MHCYVCEVGEVHSGKTTISLEHSGRTLVVNNVPATICRNCGENFIDNATRSHLLRMAQSPMPSGVQVDIREYSVPVPA